MVKTLKSSGHKKGKGLCPLWKKKVNPPPPPKEGGKLDRQQEVEKKRRGSSVEELTIFLSKARGVENHRLTPERD